MATDPKQILALYDHMEKELAEIGISFDEFIILYRSFQSTMASELLIAEADTNAGGHIMDGVDQQKPATPNNNPFPWAQAAGTGWS